MTERLRPLRRVRWRFTRALLPLALFPACSDGGVASAVVVRDSAGIPIVASTAPRLGEGAWSLSKAPVFHVGEADGADEA